MGARVKTDDFKDHIDIVTTNIHKAPDGLEKTSLVDTGASDTKPRTPIWIGLKIDKKQKLTGLSVDGKDWATAVDKEAADQLGGLMPPAQGEKWVAYRVSPDDIPKLPKFETKLKLDRHIASYPDAQSVTIAVCYVPAAGQPLDRKSILLGHSLVQSPPPDDPAAKKRK